MSERNKEVVRRFGEICLGKGELSLIDELVHPDVIDHNPLPGQPPGREGITFGILRLRTAFPDLHVVAEALVAEGDYVCARWSVAGTHLGEFADLSPTRRSFAIEGLEMHRLEDGRITELWPFFDTSLFDQIAPETEGAD